MTREILEATTPDARMNTATIVVSEAVALSLLSEHHVADAHIRFQKEKK